LSWTRKEINNFTSFKGLETCISFPSKSKPILGFSKDPSRPLPTYNTYVVLGICMRGGGLGIFIPDRLGKNHWDNLKNLFQTHFPKTQK